jgi:hypothetical protein
MKKFAAIFVQLILPVLALLFPAFVQVDTVLAAFLTLPGLVMIVITTTEGIKVKLGYEPGVYTTWGPRWVAIFVSQAYTMIGWGAGLGFLVIIPTWWMAIIGGFAIAGAAMRLYKCDMGAGQDTV